MKQGGCSEGFLCSRLATGSERRLGVGDTNCVRDEKLEKEVDGGMDMMTHDETYHYLKTAFPLATRRGRAKNL